MKDMHDLQNGYCIKKYVFIHKGGIFQYMNNAYVF
ncbi:hypothetical protein EV214_12711 [Marinisporobacter balticus]|uniref:Uncharacterized protein n=1 Tax=Marinisporobacter balticus TaxID=2018667 RepID=A0A4R2KDF9_9FIRM|nr:hypothetical protein EV214_12711 [Marinisporobacter balticus]